MNVKISNYRKFLGYKQADIAKIFGISTQAYSRKERGETAFNDQEKMIVKKMLLEQFPNITIDDIFFNQKVPKVENEEVRNDG